MTTYLPPAADAEWTVHQLLELTPAESPHGGWDAVRSDFEENHPDVMHALRADIRKHGCVTPVVVDPDTNVLHAGHHRLLCAVDEGVTSLPVRYDDRARPEAWVWNPYTRQHELYNCECGIAGCVEMHD